MGYWRASWWDDSSLKVFVLCLTVGYPSQQGSTFDTRSLKTSDPIGESSALTELSSKKTLPNSGNLRDCDLQNMMESADNSVFRVLSGHICATAANSIVTTVLGPG